ncbi:uncharacterized protein [Pocillopora verrucosa]|uniref:uncharacterized protein n=1 Tax=Pocillopora verrucosa TaxID=203993 RepID=UPI00333FAFDD
MENFEACWHSYHLECLTDSNVCPICRVGVENAIRSFSLHANRSVNLSRNTASDHDENIIDGEQGLGSGDRNDHCTADDDDDLPTSTINANIAQIFQNLTLHVMSVSERSPPVQVVSRSSINQDYPFNSQGASQCPSIVQERQVNNDVAEWSILAGPNGESCFLESHTHFGLGATITACGPAKIKQMAFYIKFIAVRDWTVNPIPFDAAFVFHV